MPPARRSPQTQVPALQLRISLNDIDPPIWRQFWVEESITLGRLHEVLQIVMGWQNLHLHQFITGSTDEEQLYYTPPWDDGFAEEEFMARQRDETRVKARTILPLVGMSISYDYDLGDCWRHTLLLERVTVVNPLEQWLPWVLDGRRSAPPEDVGGAGGYADFLRTIARPSNPEHQAMVEWSGGAFDPECFDRRAVNTALWWWAKARGRHRRLWPDLPE